MKNRLLFTVIFFFSAFLANAQKEFIPIDTSAFAMCRISLAEEYKGKFTLINKNIVSSTTAQKTIIKGIYNEIQENFFDKIKQNNFICEEKLNTYLNGLLQEVLVKNGIKETYRILLSKDSDANAYNTGNGTVVIHFGLFLTLENEDELVFVIAHEIGHQYLNHVKIEIESFAKLSTSEQVINKTKEIRSKKYGKATMAGDFLKNIRYENYAKRRKKEFAADSIAVTFYKKTLRNPKAGVTILEKLDSSDSEKDSLTIDDYKFILNKNDFKVKKSWFEVEESLFKKYDNEKNIIVDSLKTHPDCLSRIKMIRKYSAYNFTDKTTISKDFFNIKQMSIYQNLINLYDQELYGISLYEALKLYKKDIENPILKNIIYVNFSKILASKTTYTINRYVPKVDNKKNSESLNRFITLINNLKTSDIQLIINNLKS